MSVSPSKYESETQYYTYQTEKQRQELHVVDADHGIFDSKSKKKHALNPRNLVQKLKNNSSFKSNNPLTLQQSEAFDLRAEPELADSNWHNSSALGYESDSWISDDGMYQEKHISNKNSYLENSKHVSHKMPSLKKSMPISVSSNHPKKKQLDKRLTSGSGSGSGSELSKKPYLELEYEKLKIKAIRYQAERDALHIKLKKREFAQKMRDYEYYCVNGINRGPTKSSMADMIELEENEYLQPGYNGLSGYQKKIGTSQKSKGLKSDLGRYDVFDKLSDVMPPAFVQMFEVYAEYIPTTQTVQEFHKAVLIWIRSMPIINFVYPLLFALGIFIPKESKRKWSILSIIVALMDLLVLFLYGCGVYKVTCVVYRLANTFYRLGRFFGIV